MPVVPDPLCIPPFSVVPLVTPGLLVSSDWAAGPVPVWAKAAPHIRVTAAATRIFFIGLLRLVEWKCLNATRISDVPRATRHINLNCSRAENRHAAVTGPLFDISFYFVKIVK